MTPLRVLKGNGRRLVDDSGGHDWCENNSVLVDESGAVDWLVNRSIVVLK
jgi:hypothetical protein